MTEHTEEFKLLLALRRHEVEDVLHQVQNALDEDRRENAEMFDITRTDFSKNMHPNETLRALERDLAQRDEPFLCLLLALREVGMEQCLGLSESSTPGARMLHAAAAFAEQLSAGASAKTLAHRFAEVKAQHTAGWLAAALGE